MPLQDHMQIVSVDDHLIENPRVWLDRLPSKYHDVCPQIVEAQGHQMWRYEGRTYPQIGLNAVAGKESKDFGMEPVRYDDMIPGCYDPKARVQDMDVDGVQAACCYPSFPGFAGGTFGPAPLTRPIELLRLDSPHGTAMTRHNPVQRFPTRQDARL